MSHRELPNFFDVIGESFPSERPSEPIPDPYAEGSQELMPFEINEDLNKLFHRIHPLPPSPIKRELHERFRNLGEELYPGVSSTLIYAIYLKNSGYKY